MTMERWTRMVTVHEDDDGDEDGWVLYAMCDILADARV